ncbi:MAG: hypothetical protein ABW034_21235 [Steroidobacteraceae bacterium]
MSAVSRRSLLSALLALASVAVLPNRGDGAESTNVVKNVTSWLGPDAILVGARYLQLHSSEANLEVLTDWLVERLQGATSSDLPRDFSRAVQEDFGRDDVVHLDGWLLSRTEVRLCALACLADRAA